MIVKIVSKREISMETWDLKWAHIYKKIACNNSKPLNWMEIQVLSTSILNQFATNKTKEEAKVV